MKKILSIFLLAVAVFNLGGYGLFMARLEDRAVEELDKQLDNNQFSPALLITIKIPLPNLPYYAGASSAFERRYGKFEIDGAIYNSFEQRVHNDSLEIICMLDAEATRLNAIKIRVVKSSDGLLAGQGSKKKSANGSVFKFFSPCNFVAKNGNKNALFYLDIIGKSTRASLILPFYYVNVIDNPPEIG